MGSRILSGTLAAALCMVHGARADSFSSRRTELLVERNHTVSVTMRPSHAELVVRRTVYNGADRSDEATFHIDVPETAVATGLRTLATLNGHPQWYRGDLMEAESAAAKYRELTGIGGYYPKDPALLSWPAAEPPQTIAEGEGTEQLFIADRAASWLRVEGELWAKRIDRTLREDPDAHPLWAGVVFGTPLLDELTEAEMMPLAMLGGAVSPVTSYLAIEPGVRPSTDGIEETSRSAFCCASPRLRAGATSVRSAAPPIDRDAFLRDALASGWRRCGGPRGTASVTLETTFAEIVKVTTDGIRDPLLSRCLAETAWDIVLPPQFDQEWMTWSADV